MTVLEQDEGYLVDGQLVTLPVEVRDAWMIGAQFFVDADAAQEVIDYSGLTVARQLGNRAICSVTAVKYLDNDLGSYNEIAVAFVVGEADFRSPTTFIHRLPVDQPFTCAAGKGIWGFPKWITDIELIERKREVLAVMYEDDEFVLSLTVRSSPIPLPAQELAMTCYSWDDGVLRKTPWTTRTAQTTARVGGATVELGTRHPMARELRSIGLPKMAFMSMTTRSMTATFGAAEVTTAGGAG